MGGPTRVVPVGDMITAIVVSAEHKLWRIQRRPMPYLYETRTYRPSHEVGAITFRKVRKHRICSQSPSWRRRLAPLKPTISLVHNKIEARLQGRFAPIL